MERIIKENDNIDGMVEGCFYNVILELEGNFPLLRRLEVENIKWYSIFANCIDSHLYIFDKTVYSYKEAVEQVKKSLLKYKDLPKFAGVKDE